MNIEQYAKESKLPLKILRWMVRENMIKNPLSDTDLIGLSLVEKLWMRREFLRVQFAHFPKQERREFLEKTHLETKWERYAFSRFRGLKKDEKIKMQRVIDEIEMTFGFEIKQWHKDRLYNIRQQVYNLRRNKKTSANSGKTSAKSGN